MAKAVCDCRRNAAEGLLALTGAVSLKAVLPLSGCVYFICLALLFVLCAIVEGNGAQLEAKQCSFDGSARC